MPNAMQNSSLVNQINQIFTSSPLAPNAHTQLETKPKESFNKIYKNEIANGAKKTPEVSRPPQKNVPPPTNADKIVKPQKSDASPSETNTVTNEDEESKSDDDVAISDPSALLEFVDHITALASQPSASPEQEKLSSGEKSEAATLLSATDLSNPIQTISTVNTGTSIPVQVSQSASPGKMSDRHLQPENEALTAITATANTESTQLTPEQALPTRLPPVSEDRLERHEIQSQQLPQSGVAQKKESTPSFTPMSLEAIEKTTRDNKDPLTNLSSTESKAADPFIDKYRVANSDDMTKTNKELGTHKLAQGTIEPGDRAELVSKELINRFNESKFATSEHMQASVTSVATSLPALPPPPGATINGIAAMQLQDSIAPRVGSKGWDLALGQKMIWMVAGDESSVQLSLNPPDLGPLQVVLSVSDNQIDASFVSAHLDVREAIEAASPKLKEMMESAGISLSGFSVSAQANSSDNAFAQAQQQRGMSSANGSKQEKSSTEGLAINLNTGSPVISRGLVDTFV